MASPVGRSPVRRPASPPPAPTPRAQPVARPAVPAAVRIGALTGEQVIAEIERHGEASNSADYEQGLRFLELSKPKRYRDELGYQSFEQLLVARKLPSRMTAHKLIAVVSTFSQPEVKQLGGIARTYALVRYVKRQNENADPRKLLAPNARVLGRALADVKTREITRAASGANTSKEQNAAARRASARLGEALRKVEIECRMRLHDHEDLCVAVHLTPEEAIELSKLLARYRKLLKQLGG